MNSTRSRASKLFSSAIGRRGSLRRRLSVVFALLLAFGGAAHILTSSLLARRLRDITLQRASADLASTIAEQLQPDLDADVPYDALLLRGTALAAMSPTNAVYVLDGGGHVLYTLSPLDAACYDCVVPTGPLKAFVAHPLGSLPLYGASPTDGTWRVFSAAPLRVRGHEGFVYVMLDGSDAVERSRGVEKENTALAEGVLVSLSTFFGILLLGLAVLALVARRFERVTAAVSEFRDGHFKFRLNVSRNDELDQLAGTLNQMAEKIESSLGALEERDERRRELIANVSHDLRGPLTAMRLYIARLRSIHSNSGSDGAADEVSAGLEVSASKLDKLLGELFDLSKLEAKQTQLDIVPYTVEELVEELLLSHRAEATVKGLTLLSDIEPPLPLVLCDPHLIARACGNLVSNAIRYTPAGGTVKLTARRSDRGVRIAVSDTGVGISETEMPKLFDRYYRGEPGRPMVEGSTGLGLAIVQQIVELHQTCITVSSTPGAGTEFALELYSERGTAGFATEQPLVARN